MSIQFKIDRQGSKPLVTQLSGQIRAGIRSHKLRSNQKLPSIRDISKDCGISEGIVRQALNRLVSTGYLTSQHGRGIFVNDPNLRQRHLALVLPTLAQEHVVRILEGVKQGLVSADVELIILSADLDFDEESDLIRKLDIDTVAGAIIYPPFLNSYVSPLIELSERRLPFVLVDTVPENVDADSVAADTDEMGRIAAGLLLENGHRKIGLIDTVGDAPTAKGIWRGASEAFRNAGLPSEDLRRIAARQVELDNVRPWAKGRDLAVELFQQHPELTAVIAADAYIGLGAMLAFKEMGKRVPEHVSLVTIGDATVFQVTDPPVTVVDPPYTEAGRLATKRLLERIENPDAPRVTDRLKPTLIERASIARR